MRTYLIESQTVFVPYLSKLLSNIGLEIVATSREFDRREVDTHAPAAIFVDVDYTQRGAPAAICGIREATRSAAVIAFSESDDPLFAATCVISGASAVCSKNGSEEQVTRALRRAVGQMQRGAA